VADGSRSTPDAWARGQAWRQSVWQRWGKHPGGEGPGSQAGAALSDCKQLGPGRREQSTLGNETRGVKTHWDPLLGMPLVSRQQKEPTVTGTRAKPVKREAEGKYRHASCEVAKGKPHCGGSECG